MPTKEAAARAKAREEAGEPKGARRSAQVSLDDSPELDAADLYKSAAPDGRSKWRGILEDLKARTLAGKVGKGTDGIAKFKQLSRHDNVNGAAQLIKSFADNPDNVPGKFEFKRRVVVVEDKRCSEVWGRYIGDATPAESPEGEGEGTPAT